MNWRGPLLAVAAATTACIELDTIQVPIEREAGGAGGSGGGDSEVARDAGGQAERGGALGNGEAVSVDADEAEYELDADADEAGDRVGADEWWDHVAGQGDESRDDTGGESPDAGSVVEPCGEPMRFRCRGERVLQVCQSLTAPTRWIDIGVCEGSSLCCDGVCVALDARHCFGCQRECSGAAPYCSMITKDCAAVSDGCRDDSPDCGSRCPALPSPAYYVDHLADAGGNGTREHPFRTITAALNADRCVRSEDFDGGTSETAVPRRIEVAAGTYDEALGEVFPLEVRGVNLVGAGFPMTEIVGTGVVGPILLDSADYESPVAALATMVAGDEHLPTLLSGFSIHPPVSHIYDLYLGVVCERGSSQPTFDEARSTTLDGLAVGPGFRVGVVASPGRSSACHLRLISSTIFGNYNGLFAGGCSANPCSPEDKSVVLEVGGHSPSTGNTFSGMRHPWNAGDGLIVHSGVIRGSLRHNAFLDNARGLTIDLKWINSFLPHFELIGNEFRNQSRSGIFISRGDVAIDELAQNLVVNTSGSLAGDDELAAVGIELEMPFVKALYAHDNVIANNDVGVWLEPEGQAVGVLPAPGFGTSSQPGRNVFACNSHAYAGDGCDVYIGIRSSTSLPFAGNFWDHVPPTIADHSIDGMDIEIAPGESASHLDLSGSAANDAGCP